MTIFNEKNQKLEQSGILQKENIQPEDQSMDSFVGENLSGPELKELLAVILFAFFGTLLMIHLDAFENLLKFSRSFERFQFDEFAVFLPSFLAIGLVLFSYRRIQKIA